MMEKKTSKNVIEKVISGLNWDPILEVNKYFKIGVGEGAMAIPGLKRKIFGEDITKSDLKSELRSILKHVISNDLSEFFYGPWIIIWTNSEWLQAEGNLEDGTQIELEIDSTLEVIYSPQRIFVTISNPHEEEGEEDSSIVKLESMLKEALNSEKFELASKLRDAIDLQKGPPPEDK